ncbi:MAG: single-stranded DNA-binding protein [Flavobacteriales bacterium]|nr:single-stranded DNA-binding protein [Flavobacteriales bacterium]
MAGVNKVILVGHLGADPEMKTLESGAKLAKFGLATSERYKDKNGNQVDTTEWHNVILWRGLADIAERFLKKGSQVYIEGKIKTRSWDDQDGNKKYMTEIIGDNMTLLGRPGEGGGSGGDAQAASSAPAASNQASETPAAPADSSVDDDLPF